MVFNNKAKSAGSILKGIVDDAEQWKLVGFL
jgi:hypothetical protein